MSEVKSVKPRRLRPQQFNSTLDPKIRHRLAVLAVVRNTTMAELLAKALVAFLDAADRAGE